MSQSPFIVLCDSLASSGAVANVAWQQALRLSLRRPVCVITASLSSERQRELDSHHGRLTVRVVAAPDFAALRRFSHLPRHLAWILLALQALRRERVARETPVICHSHPIAAAVARFYGVRVHLILVSHGDIFHRPPGTYDPALTWLYRITTRYAHRRAQRSVALSPVMADRIQAHGVPSSRICLIPNGLHPLEIGLTAPPAVEPEHWAHGPLQLLFVGRLSPVKGLEVLFDAIALCLQAGIDLQLDLIGFGLDQRISELKMRAHQLGLDSVIGWLGPQPRANLAAHYARSHVVVVPSLDDPLPTVVLEAMACGRPVVGSDVGGISFMVLDGVTGVLVPPRQPQDLATALVRLDQDRRATAALAASALERSSLFSWTANTNALLELCQPDR